MLQLPYALNLLFLSPLCVALFRRADDTLLRRLAASLLAGLVICSALGLMLPRLFVPILMLQLVASALYLATAIIPAAVRDGWRIVPQGIAWRFTAVVVMWPWFIWHTI